MEQKKRPRYGGRISKGPSKAVSYYMRIETIEKIEILKSRLKAKSKDEVISMAIDLLWSYTEQIKEAKAKSENVHIRNEMNGTKNPPSV